MSSKAILKLDWASHEAALYACKNYHYSKCIPQGALIKIGVWENRSFIGVIIFGRGATNELGSPYGLTNVQTCELVRIALKRHIHPVSKMISIAIRMLKKSNPGLRLVVSFADRNEGHHGGIYQATNWIYTGVTADCSFPVINGKVVHPRVLSHMVANGKIKDRSKVKKVAKIGKHRYLMPLDKEMQTKLQSISKPYPKRVGSKDNVAVSDQATEGGENPTSTLHPSSVATQ